MNQIGRRLYYDKATGNVILDTGERQWGVIPITVEQEVLAYKVLSERNRNTFDVIELNFGDYSEDFRISNGVRVNPGTKRLEFSHHDPSNPTTPVYQTPLSEQVAKLKADNESLKATLDALLTDILPNLLG